MGNLRESRKGALQGMLGYLTQNETAGMVPPGEAAKKADLFIAVNASCVELGDIEQYVAETAGDKPFIIWNMELDTLRADLGAFGQRDGTAPPLPLAGYSKLREHAGLFGFPSKDLQYRFLSQFKPIFYIRQREYAKVCVVPLLLRRQAVPPAVLIQHRAHRRRYPSRRTTSATAELSSGSTPAHGR